MQVNIHLAYIAFRTEGILRAEIAQYEEAEKFCIQLISEVRTLWFWLLIVHNVSWGDNSLSSRNRGY
jgi:hypothetical protein